MTAKVDVRYAFLCDDIRREDNGKLIIVGIYDTSVNVRGTPVNLQFSVLLGLDILEIGETDLDVQITADGEVKGGVNGHLEISDKGITHAPIPPIPLLNLKGPCEISVQWRQGKTDEWRTALSIPLYVTPSQT